VCNIRLLEYSEILTHINDEIIEVDEEYRDGVFSSLSVKDQQLKNWRNYFKADDTEIFLTKGFEVVKHMLLNTKGLFSSEVRYQTLDKSMEILVEFLQKNYLSSPLRREDSIVSNGEMPHPKIRSDSVHEDVGNNTELNIKCPQNHVPQVLRKFEVNTDIDITKNEFLAEYYLYMKKEFSSFFMSSIIDHGDLFLRKQDAVGMGLRCVCTLVPIFGNLLSLAGIMLIQYTDAMLKRKLAKVCDLAVNYADLPEKISRIMAILRSHAIIQKSSTKIVLKSKNILSEALVDLGIKKNLSTSELLAYNDSKIVEGVLLMLIETKQINVLHFPEINTLLEKLIETLIVTKSIELNFKDFDSKVLTDSTNCKRVAEIDIDDKLLKINDHLPKSLKRKQGEAYQIYYDRVNKFLKVSVVFNEDSEY